MTHGALAGRRILVVEDDAIIALMQASLLEAAGCRVLGPLRRIAPALRKIPEEVVDAALLDVNLGNEKVFPIADALASRGVPFVFLTGYGSEVLPPEHRARRCLVKPCDEHELFAALCEALHANQRAAV